MIEINSLLNYSLVNYILTKMEIIYVSPNICIYMKVK